MLYNIFSFIVLSGVTLLILKETIKSLKNKTKTRL